MGGAQSRVGTSPSGVFQDNRCPECQENWEAGQWEVSRGNATQIQCEGCGKTDAVPGRLSMEEIRHMRCAQCVDKEEQKAREAARPRKVKVQPKEEVKIERDVRRMVKMITEVWMKVGIEKLDNHEGVTVKALLDSGATGLLQIESLWRNMALRCRNWIGQ